MQKTKNSKDKKNSLDTHKVRGSRKRLKGVVVASKMKKTVIVKVVTRKAHPLYRKIGTTSKKYKVHTEEDFEIGDRVVIEQSKPISKEKRWKVVEVIR